MYLKCRFIIEKPKWNYAQNSKILLLYMSYRGCDLLAVKYTIPTVKLMTLNVVCVEGTDCDGCRVGMVLKWRGLPQRRSEKTGMLCIAFWLWSALPLLPVCVYLLHCIVLWLSGHCYISPTHFWNSLGVIRSLFSFSFLPTFSRFWTILLYSL